VQDKSTAAAYGLSRIVIVNKVVAAALGTLVDYPRLCSMLFLRFFHGAVLHGIGRRENRHLAWVLHQLKGSDENASIWPRRVRFLGNVLIYKLCDFVSCIQLIIYADLSSVFFEGSVLKFVVGMNDYRAQFYMGDT